MYKRIKKRQNGEGRKGMRLLLVEDEVRLANALAYVLKKEKYIVDVTGDGIEAEDMALTLKTIRGIGYCLEECDD